MDINEVSKKKINRHPWELSRTICLFQEWTPYFDKIDKNAEYIDVGAGDMFFDKHLMRRYKGWRLNAVDIGYDTEKANIVKTRSKRVNMVTSLDDLNGTKVDFALMLDSIEYMPDEVSYIRELSSRIKEGGYIFFTMPAFQFLFSQHDMNVKNLRRYSLNDFKRIINDIKNIKLVSAHYFYFSLFLVRLFQKIIVKDIDPEKQVTTGWRWTKKSVVTKMMVGMLNIDYKVGNCISTLGIDMPGLSLMVICEITYE